MLYLYYNNSFLIVTIDTNNPSDENLTLDEDEYLEVILLLEMQ